MNRREILALSGALAAATLAGCAGGEGDPGRAATTTPTGTPGETPTEEPPSGEPAVDDDRLAALATGNAGFALALHEHLADADGGNLFVSPFSISVALAMTYAGARGTTREAMAETMRYTLGEAVHPAFEELQTRLDRRESTEDREGEAVDAFELNVANALWGRAGYRFADDYLDLVEEHYGGGLREADFGGDPDGERQRINRWVADETEGRIEDLLPRGALDPSTVLVLTNAIYFLASWRDEFDPADTDEGTFTSLDGSESTVPFMHQNVRTHYAEVGGVEAVELPYVGEEVSMVLLLPEAGRFEAFERGLDADRLFGIFEQLGDARGDLAMPKFEIETSLQLGQTLSAMGMSEAFGSGADFGGIQDGDGGLRIDEVYHDAFATVDEEGTEAAAATAVVMADSAPPDWGELRLDRPFLFCIRDRPTDAVLFLGRVVDAGDAQGGG